MKQNTQHSRSSENDKENGEAVNNNSNYIVKFPNKELKT